MSTVAKSVQARDVDSVVEFYLNRDVPAFSIRQGNQLIYAYEGESVQDGAELLGDFIQKFVVIPRSAAIYTLCVHTNLKGPISNKTEYNGSINFRMFDYADMYGAGGNTANPYASLPPALESKINGITTELAEVKKRLKEGQPDEKSKLGLVGEIFDHPLGFAIGKAFIEKFLDTKVPEPAMVSGTGFETMEDAHQRLNEALVILIREDPDVPMYLYKLSQIAISDPAKFKGFLNMLKLAL